MRLNLEKHVFKVRTIRFLGFYLTQRGIEANLDKCNTIIKTEIPSTKKNIMKLNVMLTALSIFISGLAKHTLQFYIFLRKKV